MKKTIITISIVVMLILSVPIALFMIGFFTPPAFDETYYGELSYMYKRLKETEGKKIVLIGNSAVAFGVRSDLLESEFPDYSVVNFGLYGAIGTKVMLDLSKSYIGDGDIVIIMPELIEQSLSLYFSAKEVWRAIDNDPTMLWDIGSENIGAMIGNFTGYLGEKIAYTQKSEKAPDAGVYSQKSFNDPDGNEVGYMTYDRPYNIMTGGYDPTLASNMDISIFCEKFIEYLNQYNEYVKKIGATVYFGFVPINELMTSEATKDEYAKKTYSFLCEKLDFEVIGHPAKYYMDYRWFYDNNVHMNSAGMYIFTDLLTEDIKIALDIKTPNGIPIPDIPEVPVESAKTGDNRDAAFFNYTVISGATGDYVRLTSLTEEGKEKMEIIVPTDFGGIPVSEFLPSVFAGNTTVSKITLPKTIGRIYDSSFNGCIRLSMLLFEHDSILGISTGTDYLDGADNCYIYLKTGVNSAGCAGGWVHYQSRIKYY